MKRVSIILFVALFSLAACQPTVDGSSEEAMRDSIQKIKDELPDEKREEFNDAIMTVAFEDVSLKSMMAGTQDGESIKDGAMSKLDGKSADEIIAMAEEIEARRAAEQKREQLEQARKDIKELEKMRSESNKSEKALEKFVVESSRFYKRSRRYGRDEPIIELEVTNDTDHAISRAYFKGTYATPGRSVPWIQEQFNYSISGGLEPGESAKWSLAPNMFSDWGKIEERDDAVFTVDVVQLDGPDGQLLYRVDFDEDDAARLEKLRQKVDELGE